MNNDGHLDLYIAKDGGPSLLFLQQADGTFSPSSYPMATLSGAAWGDYDRDGFGPVVIGVKTPWPPFR
jgi:hypothetical protein